MAREQLADRRLQRGGHVEALADLQELVAAEPLRERARGLLMLALYRAGRQAEALDVYRAGRELLVEELGLEPGAPLRELQAAILRHDPALSDPAARRRRNLPAPPTPLIGREREIEELAALLRGVARLVTLTGPGGTGKTRLALGAAEALLDEFADGAHFVDLSALRDPATVAPAIAHAVGLDAEAELVAQLRGRRRAARARQLRATARRGAGGRRSCSRALPKCGSWRRAARAWTSTASMSSPSTRSSTTRASSCSAPAPARAIGASSRPPRWPTWWRASSGCRWRSSSSPRTPTEMSAEEMAAGLPILELATGGPRDVPDRHRALRATIDWSLGLLDEPDRRRFAALGVFAGGLDAAAAAAVLDAAPADLDRLAGQSLLRRLPGRWAMLETLRERALELLDVAAPVRARHAAHYLELAERSEQALKGPDQATWGEQVEREHDNLRAALRHAEPARGAADRGRAGLLLVHARPQRRRHHPPRAHTGRGRRCAAAAARAGPAGARDSALPARRRAGRGDLPGGARDVPRRRRPGAGRRRAQLARGHRPRPGRRGRRARRVRGGGRRLPLDSTIATGSPTRSPTWPSWRSTRNSSTRPRRSSARASLSTAPSTTSGASRRTSADRPSWRSPAARPTRRPHCSPRRSRRCARSAIGCRWSWRSSGWPPRRRCGTTTPSPPGCGARRRRSATPPASRARPPRPRRSTEYVDVSRAALGPERFAAAATAGAALELEAALAEALTC